MDTELIESTERCSHLDHTIILAANAPQNSGRDVCLTCSGIVAYQDGLRRWQDECPCCFSQVFPEGLPDLGALPGEGSEVAP